MQQQTAGISGPMWRVENLTKVFPGVRALDDVSINIHAGQIHGLLGENGSGKSTLVKCLSGVFQPNGGKIFRRGVELELPTPEHARKAGVATIFQEFSLVPELSVAENIFLGRMPKGSGGFVDWRTAKKDAAAVLKRLEVAIDPESLVKNLSVADQQIVEIAKALSLDATLLIMDEPTTAIGLDEIDTLHRIVRSFISNDRAVIYISHRLNELTEFANVVTVLKDGRVAGEMRQDEISVKSIVNMMVGEDIENHYPKEDNRRGKILMTVRGLSAENGVTDLNFSLRSGEVLGLAGLVGSGRTEIAEALFGVVATTAGEVFLASMQERGKRTRFSSPADAIKNGLALLTENRKTTGLFMNFSARANVTIAAIKKIVRKTFLFLRKETEVAESYIEKLSVSPHALFGTVGTLSGGNQQKVLIARWLFSDADVFILDEPTRGIDVGAKVEVYETINDITRTGKSVILISADMDELMAMSDTIAVVCGKTIVSIHEKAAITKQELLENAYVSGHTKKHQEEQYGRPE